MIVKEIIMPGPSVYRIYDRKGLLLYIGSSDNLLSRLGQHKSKPWWHLVHRITWIEYSQIVVARRAEADAICREGPVFNLMGQGRSNLARVERLRTALLGGCTTETAGP